MNYTESTIDAIDEYYKQANLRFLPFRDIVQMILAALEITDEQKALRADAELGLDIRKQSARMPCDLKDFGGCGPERLCSPCEDRRILKARLVPTVPHNAARQEEG